MTVDRVVYGAILAFCGLLMAAMIAIANMSCGLPAKAVQTLEAVHTAAKKVSAVSEPAFDELCGFAVKVCIAQSDAACERLKQCQKMRHDLNAALIGVHAAINAVTTAAGAK